MPMSTQHHLPLSGGTDTEAVMRGVYAGSTPPSRVEAAAVAGRSVSRPAPPTGVRVLVVDDNVDGAEMLDEAIRWMGHTTRVAHDGEEALVLASEFKPDVALIDIGLPLMDGYEVAQRLRAMYAGDTQLIAVTGYGQASDRARTKAAGFDQHLVKPVQVSTLAKLLQRKA